MRIQMEELMDDNTRESGKGLSQDCISRLSKGRPDCVVIQNGTGSLEHVH